MIQEEPQGLYPKADPKKYETKLSPADEIKFQSWLTQNAKEGKISEDDYKHYKENGYGKDYDMRAAFQKGIKPEINLVDKQWHWNDYGKKPNEATFSNESKYHGVDGYIGGTWAEGDRFVLPYFGNKNTINDNIPSNMSIRSKLLSQMKKINNEK